MIKNPALHRKRIQDRTSLSTDEMRSIRVVQKETMMSRHLPLRPASINTVPTLPMLE